jgi:hypothetical protein
VEFTSNPFFRAKINCLLKAYTPEINNERIVKEKGSGEGGVDTLKRASLSSTQKLE